MSEQFPSSSSQEPNPADQNYPGQQAPTDSEIGNADDPSVQPEANQLPEPKDAESSAVETHQPSEAAMHYLTAYTAAAKNIADRTNATNQPTAAQSTATSEQSPATAPDAPKGPNPLSMPKRKNPESSKSKPQPTASSTPTPGTKPSSPGTTPPKPKSPDTKPTSPEPDNKTPDTNKTTPNTNPKSPDTEPKSPDTEPKTASKESKISADDLVFNPDVSALLGADYKDPPNGPVALARAVLNQIGDGQPTEDQARFLHDLQHRIEAKRPVQTHDDVPVETTYSLRSPDKDVKGAYRFESEDMAALRSYHNIKALKLGFKNIHPIADPNAAFRMQIKYDLNQRKEPVRGRGGEKDKLIDVPTTPAEAARIIRNKATSNRTYYDVLVEELADMPDDAEHEQARDILTDALSPRVPVPDRPYVKPNFDPRPQAANESPEDYDTYLNQSQKAFEADLSSIFDTINAADRELYGKRGLAYTELVFPNNPDLKGSTSRSHDEKATYAGGALARAFNRNPGHAELINEQMADLASAADIDTQVIANFDFMSAELPLIDPSIDTATGERMKLNQTELKYNFAADAINIARRQLMAAESFRSKGETTDSLVNGAMGNLSTAYDGFAERSSLSEDDEYAMYLDLCKYDDYLSALDAKILKTKGKNFEYSQLVDLRNNTFHDYLEVRYGREFLRLASESNTDDLPVSPYTNMNMPSYYRDRGISMGDGTDFVIYPDSSYGIFEADTNSSDPNAVICNRYNADGSQWQADRQLPESDTARARREALSGLSHESAVQALDQARKQWFLDRTTESANYLQAVAGRVVATTSQRIADKTADDSVWESRNTARYWATYLQADTDPKLTINEVGNVTGNIRLYGKSGNWVLLPKGRAELHADDGQLIEAYDAFGKKLPQAA